jgi:hypothetical protein
MKLYTDGTQLVLRLPTGRLQWKRGREPAFAAGAQPGVTTYQRDGLLAISPSGKCDHTSAVEALGVLDAVALDDEQVAALLVRAGKAVLGLGPPPEAPGQAWRSEIALDAVSGARIAWAEAAAWDEGPDEDLDQEPGGEQFPARAGIPAEPDAPPRLAANRWGVAVASSITGTIAVVRPGSAAVDVALQVPRTGESRVHAEPTAAGVLVTLILSGRQAIVLHVSDRGQVLGQRPGWGFPPAVLLDEHVLVYDDQDKHATLLDLALQPIAQVAVPFWPSESAAAATGNGFAFASEASVLLGKLSRGKPKILEVIDHVDRIRTVHRAREAAQVAARYDPRRASGAPAVGFPAGRPSVPWTGLAGSDIVLDIVVRSTGGRGQGIAITLSGEALQFVELDSVEVGEMRAPLALDGQGKAYAAELADVPLPEGLQVPLDPKPKNETQTQTGAAMLDATHFTIRVYGRARQAGSGLLAVSIVAQGSASAPLKWMRPLTVTEEPGPASEPGPAVTEEPSPAS